MGYKNYISALLYKLTILFLLTRIVFTRHDLGYIQNNQIPIMNNIIDLVSKTPQIIRSTCTGTFIFKLLFQSSTVFPIQPISLPSEKS